MNRKFDKGRSLLRSFLRASLPAALLLPALNMYAQQPTTGTAGPQEKTPQLHAFSLAQTIDYAAKNSATVKNALLDYQIQEQSNRAITSEALPQVTGSMGITDYIQIPTTLIPGEFINQPGTFVPVKFGTQWSANAGVTLKQVLFDGQVFVGLQARQAALDFYRKQQDVTDLSLRANI